MQFLVYLTVLMVSISTVLLEVHWLTSPAPQPKPAVQAANVSDAAAESRRPDRGAQPGLSEAGGNNSSRPGQSRRNRSRSKPRDRQNTTAAPAAVAANPEPQKPAAETTGVAARAEDSRRPQRRRSLTAATFRKVPTTGRFSATPAQATTSNNRCDVQACSSAYQSFRASDCTYQPFEGPRRVCEKPPVQRTARDQTERPERRQWSRSGRHAARQRSYGRTARL